MSSRVTASGHRWVVCCAAACTLVAVPARLHAGDDFELGRALFARDWLPDDPRSFAGDGLGPVYNETSCLACHFQGGPGGSGPASRNVEILSRGPAISQRALPPVEASSVHPGLRDARSVVFHQFGVDPEYRRWRLRLLGRDEVADMAESALTEVRQVQMMVEARRLAPGFGSSGGRLVSPMVITQRNTPPLFGAGLIDAIPDTVLLAAAERKDPDFPAVKGRAAVFKDGHIGRFGWKAQVSRLHEFVLTACANELGLEVPGHHQAASPLDPEAQPKGLDLSAEDCNALEAYIRRLPAPASSGADAHDDTQAPAFLKQGKSLFEKSGCATCHTPQLGNVDGIYSDLLLHDMGPNLADGASYYGRVDPSPGSIFRSEDWRTPPPWGFADSAPYLHDGRVNTLEEAVALHGGEAMASTERFFRLLPTDRLKLQAFLRSLPAPGPEKKPAK